MPHVHASRSGHVPAAPPVVYAVLTDYHDGHARILPERYFAPLEVVAGGRGAGTRIRVGTRLFGTVRYGIMEVTEPEPGRLLQERDPATGIVTTFRVEPEGPGSRVTIATDWDARGVAGVLLRVLLPGMLQKIYAEELALLAEVAASRAAQAGVGKGLSSALGP